MHESVESMRTLGMSLAATGLLVLCGEFSDGYPKTIVGAIRWGSVTTLLFLVYYTAWYGWAHGSHCRRQERRELYTRPLSETEGFDVELEPLDEPLEPTGGAEVQARVVLYPELTVGSVWVYVYGWGLLLFVCLYCLSGLETMTSCWWVLGMLTLVFDELIQEGVRKEWVLVTGLCVLGSGSGLWLGEREGRQDDVALDEGIFGHFLMSVALPVVIPFIFFSIRSRVQPAVRDVSRLCELAAPFMVVLSVCTLMGTMHEADSVAESTIAPPARRGLNWTGFVETPARFYATGVRGDPGATQHKYVQYAAGLGAPVAGAWALRSLIHAVLNGKSTEFIVAFLLALSTRYGVTHAYSVLSLASMGLAGMGFSSVLIMRRVI